MSKEKALPPLSEEQSLAISEKVRDLRLSQDELEAYRYYCASDLPPLPPTVQDRFFVMFLNGTPLKKIAKLNASYTLGQVVSASIEGKWQAKIQEHTNQLIAISRDRLLQVQLESIQMLGNLITAANLETTKKYFEYLQSGDPNVLGDLKIDSLYQLEKAVNIIKTLTSTDKGAQGNVLNVNIEGNAQVTSSKGVSDTDAAAILRMLVENKDP